MDLAREILWFDYWTLRVITDLHHCGQEQFQLLLRAEFPWSRPKSRWCISSSYHLLELVHSAAQLLEHESLENCFCTRENCEHQGNLPKLLSHLNMSCFIMAQAALLAGWWGFGLRAALRSPPRLCCELISPLSQRIPGEPPVQQCRPCYKQVFFIIVGVSGKWFPELWKKNTTTTTKPIYIYIYKFM